MSLPTARVHYALVKTGLGAMRVDTKETESRWADGVDSKVILVFGP